jgi:hypothetical protein
VIEDAPIVTLDIAYDAAGLRSFRYDCEAGALGALDPIVRDLRDALLECRSTSRVTVHTCE